MNKYITILKESLPSNNVLDTLDASILAADPTETDICIKDLKKQINELTNQIRKIKNGRK